MKIIFVRGTILYTIYIRVIVNQEYSFCRNILDVDEKAMLVSMETSLRYIDY